MLLSVRTEDARLTAAREPAGTLPGGRRRGKATPDAPPKLSGNRSAARRVPGAMRRRRRSRPGARVDRVMGHIALSFALKGGTSHDRRDTAVRRTRRASGDRDGLRGRRRVRRLGREGQQGLPLPPRRHRPGHAAQRRRGGRARHRRPQDRLLPQRGHPGAAAGARRRDLGDARRGLWPRERRRAAGRQARHQQVPAGHDGPRRRGPVSRTPASPSTSRRSTSSAASPSRTGSSPARRTSSSTSTPSRRPSRRAPSC